MQTQTKRGKVKVYDSEGNLISKTPIEETEPQLELVDEVVEPRD